MKRNTIQYQAERIENQLKKAKKHLNEVQFQLLLGVLRNKALNYIKSEEEIEKGEK